MKRVILRAVMMTLCLGWMGLIFYFSSQSGSASSTASNRLTNFLIDIFVKDYDILPRAEQKEIYLNTSYLVRKTAHLSEFAFLALLLFLTVWCFTPKKITAYGLSFLITFLYALSDEFHQKFVQDRSAMFKDVIIDCLGAVLILCVVAVVDSLINLKKSGKEVID